MAKFEDKNSYFPFSIQITARMWERLELDDVLAGTGLPGFTPVAAVRQVASRLNALPERPDSAVSAGQLIMYALMVRVYRHIISRFTEISFPGSLEAGLAEAGYGYSHPDFLATSLGFATCFPGGEVLRDKCPPDEYLAKDPDHERKKTLLRELLLLRVAAENRALEPFRELLDDGELAERTPYLAVMDAIETSLRSGPLCDPLPLSLPELLRAPLRVSPHSLAGQIAYIKEHWRVIMPETIYTDILVAMDIAGEEFRSFPGGSGPPRVLEFGPGADLHSPDEYYPEPERFSADLDWMPNLVLLAKMVYVWLGQLSREYGREISRLDQIPDKELDRLARRGFTGLWLIGIWERSSASQRIKRLCGNPEAISSAYSLFDYQIAADIGGWEALGNLRERALKRGIRLASDMVPNHTGIYSRWTMDHPDWFIQLAYPPYPSYTFNGPDLSESDDISLHLEDGYWNKRDAGVVFKHYDHRNGRTRYIYHGNDGTSTPWNDTAQLDYLNPEVREAVIQTILHVARNFPIIRFDAAMTLAKKHYQRLWFPQPGLGSGIPSRAEHGMTRAAFDAAMPEEFWRMVVDRVAAEVPDTLLLAEAFWLMEGYFVRTLGMHRVYNSAFMNMLKQEENAKYRQTVKNVLEFNPEILKRFVNFMNNPDEKTAVEQFGRESKYFGAALLLVTMPGLPMIGHGQVEGFHEKYGMEYKKAYWDEPVDEHLLNGHKRLIFPLMRRRRLFSGSEQFVFYDFDCDSHVDENVFAYSNRVGPERALILFHNSHARTSGWIRLSTSIAVKDGDGQSSLLRKTLGEALEFNGDGRHYYLFRDYATDMEYIRNGRELCEQGLYVELGEYECHAFLDFREIWDDEFGTWGALCQRLQGQPVASLDQEVKLIRFADVLDPFRASVQSVSTLLAAGPEASCANAQEALALFLAALASRSGCKDRSAVLAKGLAGLVGLLAPVSPVTSAEDVISSRPSLGAPPSQDGNYMASLIVLRLVVELAGSVETAAAWYCDYGLELVVADNFDQMGRKASGNYYPDGAGAAGLVPRLLIVAGVGEGRGKKLNALLAGIIERPETRSFLLCHESGGVEWFVKERFEFLCYWLSRSVAISRLLRTKSRSMAAPATPDAAAAELVELGAKAGYRLAELGRLLAGAGKGKKEAVLPKKKSDARGKRSKGGTDSA